MIIRGCIHSGVYSPRLGYRSHPTVNLLSPTAHQSFFLGSVRARTRVSTALVVLRQLFCPALAGAFELLNNAGRLRFEATVSGQPDSSVSVLATAEYDDGADLQLFISNMVPLHVGKNCTAVDIDITVRAPLNTRLRCCDSHSLQRTLLLESLLMCLKWGHSVRAGLCEQLEHHECLARARHSH